MGTSRDMSPLGPKGFRGSEPATPPTNKARATSGGVAVSAKGGEGGCSNYRVAPLDSIWPASAPIFDSERGAQVPKEVFLPAGLPTPSDRHASARRSLCIARCATTLRLGAIMPEQAHEVDCRQTYGLLTALQLVQPKTQATR